MLARRRASSSETPGAVNGSGADAAVPCCAASARAAKANGISLTRMYPLRRELQRSLVAEARSVPVAEPAPSLVLALICPAETFGHEVTHIAPRPVMGFDVALPGTLELGLDLLKATALVIGVAAG